MNHATADGKTDANWHLLLPQHIYSRLLAIRLAAGPVDCHLSEKPAIWNPGVKKPLFAQLTASTASFPLAGLFPLVRYSSSTSRKRASHAGCAVHAGPVTSRPSTTASVK